MIDTTNTPPTIAHYLDNTLKIWQSADETAKRDILRILLECVIIDTNAKKIAAFVPRRDFVNMFEASKQLRYLVDGSDGFQHITRGIAAYKLPQAPLCGSDYTYEKLKTRRNHGNPSRPARWMRSGNPRTSANRKLQTRAAHSS